MFKVVEFEDSGLGIVREEWMTPRKKECFWPPYKITSKFNKCLTTKITPDENWQIYGIKRILYETDDLITARVKCKKAESDSELISEIDLEDEPLKKKRKRKILSFDSDSEFEETVENYSYIKYPMPPKTKLPQEEKQLEPESQTKISTNVQQRKFTTKQSQQPAIEIHLEPESRAENCIHYNKKNSTFRSSRASTPKFHEDCNVDSPVSCSSCCSNPQTCDSTFAINKINASLNLLAQHIGDIKSDIKDIKLTQNDILLRTSSSKIDKITLPDEIVLPLKSLEDLNNLLSWLEIDENKENLINHLSYIGGNKISIITRRILAQVFTNTLATKCNWTGKNNKFSLKNTHLTKVILSAVRRNKVAETATDAEITDPLTSWFRFARDRDGGRENRRTRANE